MKALKGLALGAVAAAFLVAAPAALAGPTTVTYVYTVTGATVPGLTTSFVLEAGKSVTVTATGAVCPYGNSFCPGPNGDPFDTTGTSFGGFPLPGAPAWGLIARVGSGPWVQVGSGPTTLTGTGALAFAVNDDLLVDNSGSFTVTVSYSCWPGWGYGDKNHTHCGPPGLADKPEQRSAGEARHADGPGESAEAHAEHGNDKGKAKGHSK
jgi:hypothetical protein